MAFYGPRGGEVGGATWPGGKRHAWGELRERMAHLEGLLEGLREAITGLSEVAFKLRRELTPKAPALKTAIKAERETFHLKGELQRLDMEDLEQATGRNSDHLAVESRRDLASCHGSIVRIAAAHS